MNVEMHRLIRPNFGGDLLEDATQKSRFLV